MIQHFSFTFLHFLLLQRNFFPLWLCHQTSETKFCYWRSFAFYLGTELVKHLMQIMHITLIWSASTGSVYFKFDFDLFLTFCMFGFFLLFSFIFKVNSGVFLHNRLATLRRSVQLFVCWLILCKILWNCSKMLRLGSLRIPCLLWTLTVTLAMQGFCEGQGFMVF